MFTLFVISDARSFGIAFIQLIFGISCPDKIDRLTIYDGDRETEWFSPSLRYNCFESWNFFVLPKKIWQVKSVFYVFDDHG